MGKNKKDLAVYRNGTRLSYKIGIPAPYIAYFFFFRSTKIETF